MSTAPKFPGILTVTLHEAEGLSAAGQYRELFSGDSDGPNQPSSRLRYHLPYALLDYERLQVSVDSLLGTAESPQWLAQCGATCKFDISRTAELAIQLYLKDPKASKGSQDVFLGVARLNPFNGSIVSGPQWMALQGGTGKILVSLEYAHVENQMLDIDTSDYAWLGPSGVVQVKKKDTRQRHLHGPHRFDVERARLYAAEMVCALEYLHNVNIIGWLKAGNVLLDSLGHVTLCGFGLFTRHMEGGEPVTHKRPEYPAPESLVDHENTPRAADWWTLGVFLYEMLTGLPPFYDNDVEKIRLNILNQPLEFPNSLPSSATDVLHKLLNRDPRQRLGAGGAAEVKGHLFFEDIDWSKLMQRGYQPVFKPGYSASSFQHHGVDYPPERWLSLEERLKQFAGFTYNRPSGQPKPKPKPKPTNTPSPRPSQPTIIKPDHPLPSPTTSPPLFLTLERLLVVCCRRALLVNFLRTSSRCGKGCSRLVCRAARPHARRNSGWGGLGGRGVMGVGRGMGMGMRFADDTNLLVFGRNPEANVRQLEAAWETCIRWADSRGMKFAPEKSELIHFNKGRRQWTEQVNLANPRGGTSPVKPEGSARFLGVWLDWKLNWKAHLVAVEKKLRTQSYALSRIVAKTWGMGLAKAREVYTKCIRSALAYGASSFHIPTDVGGEPAKKGITKALGKAQNKSLRIVAGAFKSTPIRNLETETWVPPLDLYLNKRLADFENRLQQPDLDDGRGGKKTAASVVLTACRKIQQRLSSRRGNRGRPRTLGPQGPTAVERAAGTVMRWTGGTVDTNRVVEEAWKARWLKERDGRAITRPADDFDHQQETLFRNETLRRHDGLSKAKSSLLIQIRTGAIGLWDFLFTREVPEVLTPACECGEG
ncbi:hypothetical protein CHGG_01471 [Chaetomium globosum CBS 148.51]|uniref:Protein kinase domain-containing protein n=1 Tax=Chaetomium globosum (strain ATCC 6205 / CBS 148.51 / DSM 1962 / NBRC 6347 / NRRL 1970) TaxID=306901 RepID=Q2HE83_CHAGB|nr:uncharacterized protein CHGG_01471 [Chaetomium globosum CBS 148.51]EAQ93236.1 hypothetical protein CHGG_01471 [Chaetomium globosum CBS 148.51]